MAATLTERQAKWFESLRASFVGETGRTLEEWVEIAKRCPETTARARLRWFKETHGLGQNRASVVLGEAFPAAATWEQPDALRGALWKDDNSLAILKAIEAIAMTLDGTVVGQRKGYTAFSRSVQYAAARPAKGGAFVGFAVEADEAPDLDARGAESWSHRLSVKRLIAAPADVDARIEMLMKQAWERS